MPVGTLPRQQASLSCGTVSYLRHGSGPPLLLVHGIPTSARLWEPLLGALGQHFDCIVPDLLGLGRSRPTPEADLSSPGQAAMLVELLDALGVDETLLALHDHGGSHGQQLMVHWPERVRAVAFCDVVCFDNWPVPVVDLMAKMARYPAAMAWLWRSGLLKVPMRSVFPLPQTVARGRLPDAMIDDWFYALETGDGVEGWCRYVQSQSDRWTRDAVPTLENWKKPAHVFWATDDRFLPPSWAVRLARTVGSADDRPTFMPNAGHFFQAEIPVTAAEELIRFFRAVD